MKTSDDTLVKLVRYLNTLYQEYKIGSYSNLASQLIKIDTILNFLLFISDKPVVYVLSNRHTDVDFIAVFPSIRELEEHVGCTSRSIARCILPGKVSGIYTSYGYVQKIKVKDFVDRWFLKINKR